MSAPVRRLRRRGDGSPPDVVHHGGRVAVVGGLPVVAVVGELPVVGGPVVGGPVVHLLHTRHVLQKKQRFRSQRSSG